MKRIKLLAGSRRRKAMTLSEVLVGAVLVAGIVGAISAIMIAGMGAWRMNDIRAEQSSELRKAMNWLMADLVMAGASVVDIPDDGQWYTTISFKKATGVTNGVINWSANDTQYAKVGTDPVRIQRTVGIASRYIAQNIESIEFRRLAATPSVVEVRMTAKNSNLQGKYKDVTSIAAFQVRMRNS